MRPDELPVLPALSGVYIFRDAASVPIYIGKAKVLRNRVPQHFKAGGKSQTFTSQAQSLEFITTDNEIEALLLEANLIKQHRPHYNVLLKDDKQYPFLKLTAEAWPMLIVTRRVVQDGGTYFGPYPDGTSIRSVKHVLDGILPLRKNSGLPFKRRSRPCLNHHMGRCLAPCVGKADPNAYRETVAQARQLLEGQTSGVVEMLEGQMRQAAARQDFEQAAALRNRIQAVRKTLGIDQQISNTKGESLDFLGLAQAGEFAMVQLFRMRDGRVIGRDQRFMTGAALASTEEILQTFLREYYSHSTHIPPLILLPEPLEDAELWQAFLRKKSGRTVEFRIPQRGEKVALLEMATNNAKNGLESELLRLERRGDHPGLDALKDILGLVDRPWRIEGFDNSNLFGTHIVSAMVVFEGGKAKRSDYRRFRVKGLKNPDDYAAMEQTVLRRFTGSLSDTLPLPDLILIDGGRGQQNAAIRALEQAGLEIPVVALAKRQETIVLPTSWGARWWLEPQATTLERSRELHLPLTHPALRVLIGVRDEVHRYVIQYHRKLRDTDMLKSIFAELPGIGEKRQAALLEHFTSLEDIAQASAEEIARVPGMNLGAAKAVKSFLEEKAREETK